MNTIDVKAFFVSAVKCLKPDCLFDIGSRDGDQSLLLRDLSPGAYVGAFEANPDNYQAICARNLDQRNIQVFPYAVSDKNGTATFYVVDPNAYPGAHGSSSLLAGNTEIKKTVEVETRRLDDFVLEHVPQAQRIILWMDVESAEYYVLQGMEKIKDRVLLVYTETSTEAHLEGQKVLSDLIVLMKSYGFTLCGVSIKEGVTGDVVFIQDKARAEMGISYSLCLARASIYRFLPINQLAGFLKRKFPAVHRLLRRAYLKFAS